MHCPYCGGQLHTGDTFCAVCRNRVPFYAAPEGFTPNRERGLYMKITETTDPSGAPVRRIVLFDPVAGAYQQQEEPILPRQMQEPPAAPPDTGAPEAPRYASPPGFALHEETGLYFREEADAVGGVQVTWFDPYTGEYEQVTYPLGEEEQPAQEATGQPDEILPAFHEPVQPDDIPEHAAAPEPVELPETQYAPPEGFSLHAESGLYYRKERGDQVQATLTWFDPAGGEYAQILYEREAASPVLPEGFTFDEESGLAWRLDSVEAQGGGRVMRSTWYEPESGRYDYRDYPVAEEVLSAGTAPGPAAPVPQPPQPAARPKSGKRAAVIAIAAVVVVALVGGFWAVRSGLVTLPALGGGGAASSSSKKPITWAEASLESAVREHLGKPEGDITSADLAGVKEIHVVSNHIYFGPEPDDLDEDQRGSLVANLEDFAHFPDLTKLSLINQPVSDLSPLSGLSNLGVLEVSLSDVSDIGPLSGLTNLTWLNLKENHIEDISPLAGLTKLEYLHIQSNPIKNFSALAGLTKLRNVYIHNTGFHELSLLADKTEITALVIANNPIGDLAPLRGLTKLDYLHVSAAGLQDISPLADLKELRRLNLMNNDIEDIGVLAGLPKLSEVYLEGNPIADYSPVDHVPNVFGRLEAPQDVKAVPQLHRSPDEWKELLVVGPELLLKINDGELPEADRIESGLPCYKIPEYEDSYLVFSAPDEGAEEAGSNVLLGLLISVEDAFDAPSITLAGLRESLGLSYNDFGVSSKAISVDGALRNTVEMFLGDVEVCLVLNDYEFFPDFQRTAILLATNELEDTPFTWLWVPNGDAFTYTFQPAGTTDGSAELITGTYISFKGEEHGYAPGQLSTLNLYDGGFFDFTILLEGGEEIAVVAGEYNIANGRLLLNAYKIGEEGLFGFYTGEQNLIRFAIGDSLVLESPASLGLESAGDEFFFLP